MKLVRKLMLPLVNGERRLRFVTIYVYNWEDINKRTMDAIVQTENFKVGWTFGRGSSFLYKPDIEVDFEQLTKEFGLNLVD